MRRLCIRLCLEQKNYVSWTIAVIVSTTCEIWIRFRNKTLCWKLNKNHKAVFLHWCSPFVASLISTVITQTIYLWYNIVPLYVSTFNQSSPGCLSTFPSLVQIFCSASYSQTPSVYVLPLMSEINFHNHTKLQAKLQLIFKFLDSRWEDRRFWTEW
jgi:hypothetical protein